MAKGGAFGVEVIDWFNGGLFDDGDTLALNADEFKQLLALSKLDWSDIEPAIFGTLFERGLDPAKRSQLGAHYTDPDARFPSIAEAAKRLNELRENWLNPPEWVERVPEVVPGYPDRILPKSGHEADLKKRTLTNLYNQRPAWLDNAHKALDKAVANAYGWADYSPAMPDETILSRLLGLNLQRERQAASP